MLGIGLDLTSVGRQIGGFRPASLGTQLLAHWTTDNPALITESAGAVSSWKDTVAAYNMAQATGANKPAYSTTSYNGAPGITFDGTSDYLDLGSQPFPSGVAVAEIWTIADQTEVPGVTGIKKIFEYGGGSATNRRGVSRTVVTGVNRLRSYYDSTGVAVATVGDLSGRHVTRTVFSATTVSQYFDGVLDGSATPSAPNTGTSGARIGANLGTATEFWKGVVRDILITRALSASEVTALAAWAQARK